MRGGTSIHACAYISLRTYMYAQIIIGENLIWWFCDRSQNRQIKALAKISRYTVHCTCTCMLGGSPMHGLILRLLLVVKVLTIDLYSGRGEGGSPMCLYCVLTMYTCTMYVLYGSKNVVC